MTKPPEEAPGEVCEAEQVYLLMSKDHRISRNIRAQWYLDHFNTVLHYSDSDSDAGKPKVISVLSKSHTWNEASPPCRVTTKTTVNFLSTHHALVFAFDVSPSTACSAATTNDVILECMFEAFRNCVIGLTKPFKIPGSSCVLTPYLYVTVIAYSPLINCPVRQVLLHGYLVTCETVQNFLDLVYSELDRFENEVASFVDKLLKGDDTDVEEQRYDNGDVLLPADRLSRMHMPADVAFFNLLRNAMLAIQLLPDNCNAGIIVVTDGVIGVPDVGRCDVLFTQLITQSCTCSFIEVSNPDWLRTGLGHVPHSELLKFFASATFGAYFSHTLDKSKGNSDTMNIYHEGILCWSFQKSIDGFICENGRRKHTGPVYMSGMSSRDLKRMEFHVEHLPQWTLTTSLLSVVSSRLKDGFSIKSVSVEGAPGEAVVTVIMVLPWKHDVHIKYSAKTGWTLDCRDKKAVVVDVTYEGPYHFIHDLTCMGGIWAKMKSKAPTSIRKAVNSKFVRVLHSIKVADQVLEKMQKFATEKACSAVPENVRSGVSVFSLGSESKPNDDTVNISSRDQSVITFAGFWKPLIDIDMKSNSDHQKPSDLSSYTMEKWFHIHRINLVLEHDMPLPSFLHHPNKAGKYSSIECRPAFTSLCSWFSNWSTFVLISEQYYVKFISSDSADSETKLGATESRPSSFCFIRMIAKPPCVTLRLNFLGGTSTKDRNKIMKELKDELSKLHFPKRAVSQSAEARSGKHRAAAAIRGGVAVSTSPSSAQEHKPPLQRDWSEVTCCVLLSKPVDRILVRYDRVPSNILSLDHIWSGAIGSGGLGDGIAMPSQYLTSNHLARINSYLHHQRWVWGLHLDGFEALDASDVSKILSIITQIRLQEGFHFAHSHAGMTSMILEVDMKNESSANADVELQAEASSSSVIQYITFPPQTVRRSNSNYGDSDSEDESPSVSDINLRLVTECWIEPQFGVVQNSAPERAHFDGCVFSELPQKIFPVDHGCITSLVTFEHLLRFCQRKAGSRIRNGAGSSRDKPRDSAEHDEPRVRNILFTFDAMSLLSKCQQVELLFCTYAAADTTSSSQTEDANNILLQTLIDELSRSSNEIELSEADCLTFVRHVHARRHLGGASSAAAQVSRQLNFDAWAQPSSALLPTPAGGVPGTPSAVLTGDDIAQQPLPPLSKLRSATTTPTTQLGAAAAARAYASSPYPVPFERADLSQYDTDTSAAHASVCTPPPSAGGGATAGCQVPSPPRWRCFAKRAPPTVVIQPQPLAGSSSGGGGNLEKGGGGGSERPTTAVLTLIPETYADLQKLLGPGCERAAAAGANDSGLSVPTTASGGGGAAAAVLPVYVYYCSYASLTERLVNRWSTGSGGSGDIFEDFRFVTEQPVPSAAAGCTTPGGGGGRVWRTSLCSGTSGDDDAGGGLLHRRRSRTLSSGTSLLERSMSGESYGEESELQAHCRRLRDLYYRSFILGLYQSLQQGYVMASCDVEAAITSICEEESVPVEINLTEFLHMSCSHYQSHVRSAAGSRCAEQDGSTAKASNGSGLFAPGPVSAATPSLSSPLDSQRKIVTFDIFEDSAAHMMGATEAADGGALLQAASPCVGSLNASSAGHLAEQPLSPQQRSASAVPLSKLLTMAGPPSAAEPSSRLCNSEVKRKFAELFDAWFRPVPTCPEYYYYRAQPVCSRQHSALRSYRARSERVDSTADPDDNEIAGIVSALNECSDTTESDELFDATAQNAPVASSARKGVAANRLTYMSISSSLASEPVSNDDPPPTRRGRRRSSTALAGGSQAPLFLQLVCSLRSERRPQGAQHSVPPFFEQLPIASIPTCFCELHECFYGKDDVPLSSLMVTLDMVCVKLPADSLDDSDEQGVQTEEAQRELTAAQLLDDDDDYEVERDIGAADSSFDSKVASDGDDIVNLALPRAQKRAIMQCREQVEWLIADEMASARRQEAIVTPETLRAVVEHVDRSQGKSSCRSEKVPLDFVYGHELSFNQFVKDFEELSLPGYRLVKTGDYYYLVRSGHRMSSSMVASGIVIPGDGPGALVSPSTADEAEKALRLRVIKDASSTPVEAATAAGGYGAVDEEDENHSTTTARPITVCIGSNAEQALSDAVTIHENQRPSDHAANFDIASIAQSLDDLPQRDRISEWPRDTDEDSGMVAGTHFGSLPRSYSSVDVQQHIPACIGGGELHVGIDLRRISSTADRALGHCGPEEEVGMDIPSRKTRHVSEGGAIRKRASFANTIPSPAQTREFLTRDPSMLMTYGSRSRHTTGSLSRPRTPMSAGGAYPDSFSGYDADLSDDEVNDGSICSSGISRKSSRLPDFWLILQLTNEHVTVTFHCSSMGTKASTHDNSYSRYTKLFADIIDNIRRLCRRVNQFLLLRRLFETRSCIDLLVPKDDDEILRGDEPSGVGSSMMTAKSQKDSDSDDEFDRSKQEYLEASLKLTPGHFACECVGQMQFSIHPRLKASNKSTPVARATAAFMSVLSPFAISNQRNMFVFKEQSGNVFYLRLDESPVCGPYQSDAVVPKVEDEVFSNQLSGSRSSSVPSLSKLDKDESESTSKINSDALDSLSISSRMANIARRGEDCVVLRVFGICGPGPEIMKELNQALVAKLHDRVLDELSMLLKKNQLCKLSSDDVAFIQKDRLPHEERTFAVPAQLSAYILPLLHFLRQNIKHSTLCFHPKYADAKSETHFKDFTQAVAPEMCEEDTYIYNKPKETQASDKGSGIALVYVKLLDSHGAIVKTAGYSHPELDPEAYKLLENCTLESLTALVDVGKHLPMPGGSAMAVEHGKTSLRLPSLSTQYYIRFSIWLLMPDSDILVHEQRGHLVRALKHALRDTITQNLLLSATPLCGPAAPDMALGRDEPMTPYHLGEEPRTPTRHGDLMRAESLHDDLSDFGGQRRAPEMAALGYGSRRRSAFALFDTTRSHTASPLGRDASLPAMSYGIAFDDASEDPKSKTESGQPEIAEEALPLTFVGTLIKWFDFCAANNLVTDSQSMCRVVCGNLPEFLSNTVMSELHDVFRRQLTPNANIKLFCCDGARYMQHDPSSSQPLLPASGWPAMLSTGVSSSDHLPSHILLVYNCAACGSRPPVDAHGQATSSASADSSLKGSKSGIRIPAGTAPYSGSYSATDPTSAATSTGVASTVTPYALPRQQLITVFVRHRQIQMYICNWTDEYKSKQISTAVQRVVQWSNDRLHVLDCVAMHKAGLFHLASFATSTAAVATAAAAASTGKEPASLSLSASSARLSAGLAKDELRVMDIERLVSSPRCVVADQPTALATSVSAGRLPQPQLQSATVTAAVAAGRQLPQAPREGAADHLLTAATLDGVYRTSERHSRPLQSLAGGDLLQQHGSQLLALHEAAIRERERKDRLLKLHQELQKGNNTIPDAQLNLLKDASRVVHIVATPLFFSPHWRKKAMAQLVQSSKQEAGAAASATQPLRVPAPDAGSSGSGRSRHSSGASGKMPPTATSRGDSPMSRAGVIGSAGSTAAPAAAGSVLAARPYEEEHWHIELRQHFVNKYIEYMRQPHSSRENHGFSPLPISSGSLHSAKMSGSATGFRKPPARLPASATGKEAGSPTATTGAEATPARSGDVRYLQKSVTSGTFLMELSFEDVYFCVKLYVCNALHFSGSKDTRDAMPMFIDTCDRMRDHTHCHSFAHDFHLRMVHKHVRGQGLFNSSYHLTSFLQDFRRFHAWAPRYARSLLKIGSVDVSNTGNIPHQLYDYIVNNKDDYSLKNLNMVEPDHSGQACERALAYDYVLPSSAVDLSGQSLKQKPGELEVAVIISHDIEASLNLDLPADALLLKYHVVLCNKTKQFPFRQHYAAVAERVLHSRGNGSGGAMTAQELAHAELAEKMRVGSVGGTAYSASPATGWLTSYATAAQRDQVACTQSAPAVEGSAGSTCHVGLQQRPYYELLDQQALLAKEKIKEIVRGASTGCRRDSLWAMLRSQPATAGGVTDDEQLQSMRRRRDVSGSRENLVPKLSLAEFQELLHLVRRVPINAYDEMLQTFANMPTSWYTGLNQALMRKYTDFIRPFQRDNHHYLVVLVPKYEDVAVLLEVQPLSDVSLLFRVHTKSSVHQPCDGDVLALPAEVSQFLEDFVSTMCYHMWQNMVMSS